MPNDSLTLRVIKMRWVSTISWTSGERRFVGYVLMRDMLIYARSNKHHCNTSEFWLTRLALSNKWVAQEKLCEAQTARESPVREHNIFFTHTKLILIDIMFEIIFRLLAAMKWIFNFQFPGIAEAALDLFWTLNENRGTKLCLFVYFLILTF